MRSVIGVDGGATATRGALADERGEILATAAGPTVSPRLATRPQISVRLRDLFESLARDGGCTDKQIAAVGLGVSGCDRPEDRTLLESAVREILPQAVVAATNDAEVALIGALGEREGIIVISGTGSIAYGFRSDDRSFRSGGHGHWLGDEGGGFAIAQRGLIGIMRAHDGRGPETALTGHVLRHLGLAEPSALRAWMDAHAPQKAEVAALAPLVFEMAAAKDAVCSGIVAWACDELALAVGAVADELWDAHAPVNCAVSGKLLLTQAALISGFNGRLLRRWPNVQVRIPEREAVVGAVIYALKVLS
jgi:N-acetylglucosamine kinase-like BadF-type ATPase